MTIEEAWLMWMKTSRKTSEPATIEDFEVIKKSSHWAAFEAGWNAANVNSEFWDQAYKMGLEAGKEIKKHWVGLTDEEIFEHEWWDEETAFHVNKYLKEKNT